MGVYKGPSIVSDGLIIAYDAANPKSYPGTGATWFDLSGYGNNATITTGTFVAGTTAATNYFTGSDITFDLRINDSTSISNAFTTTTGGWTIEEVIRTDAVGSPLADGTSIISVLNNVAGDTGFDWNQGDTTTTFEFGLAASAVGAGVYDDQIIISSIPAEYSQLGVWRVRTMVWNRGANTVSLYINGTYIGGGSTTVTAGQSLYDGGGMRIGTGYGWRHNGRRAKFSTWNRVLTAAEIQQNFNAHRSRYNL